MKEKGNLNDYIAALGRLKSGNTKNVPPNTRITNDAVSLEAGRAKGSIKRARPGFADLIAEIEKAAQAQRADNENALEALESSKMQALHYRRELEAALAREVSLLRELLHVKKELALLTGAKIVPIRGTEQKRKA